jgi:hypothetical protein
MKFFPNGNAAMKWLAASTGANEMGITQVTEILPIVTYAALPDEFQAKATHSVGLPARAPGAGLPATSSRVDCACMAADAGRRRIRNCRLKQDRFPLTIHPCHSHTGFRMSASHILP